MKTVKTLKIALIAASVALLAACGQRVEVPPAHVGKITGDYFSSVGGRSFEFKEAKVLSESEVEADYPSPQTINGRIGARIAGRAILAEAALKKGFTDI